MSNTFKEIDILKLNIDIGYEDISKMPNGTEKAVQYAIYGLTTDGGHHKQWHLERVLESLGVDLDDLDYCLSELDSGDACMEHWEKGIAP